MTINHIIKKPGEIREAKLSQLIKYIVNNEIIISHSDSRSPGIDSIKKANNEFYKEIDRREQKYLK